MANSGLLTYFAEPLAIVEIKLGDAIVVGDEQVRMPGSAQVCRGSSQRPTPAIDAHFLSDIFKFSVAEIMEQILPAAVLSVLKTFRHHLCCFEMPEVDMF